MVLALDDLPPRRIASALALLRFLKHLDAAGGVMHFLDDTPSMEPAADLELAGLVRLRLDGYAEGGLMIYVAELCGRGATR